MNDLAADAVIRLLALQAHPEGGWFRETFRDPRPVDRAGRGASTAIYYLLQAGECAAWHRVDAAELWHWYGGAALALQIATSPDDDPATMVLGPDLVADQRPQAVVPAGQWQSARSLGAWTLVGCTVAPAFSFAGFELAAPSAGPPA